MNKEYEIGDSFYGKKKRNIFNKVINIILVPLLLLIIFFIVGGTNFLSVRNLMVIVQQSVAPSFIVWGLCFAMTMGIFDLTPGVIIILGSMIATILAIKIGYTGLIIGGLGVGTIIGIFNGTIFLKLRIPSMIVTVGMVMIYEVLASLYSKGQGIYLPDGLQRLAQLPYNVILWIGVFIIVFILYNRTSIGIHMKAISGSERTAGNAGINTKKTKFFGFLFCGLLAGLAGILYQSYGRYVEPQVGMNSLAIVFPSLTGFFYALSISRWVNLIIAVLIGQVTIALLMNGLIIVGFPSTVQQIALGILLITTVAASVKGQKEIFVK